MYIFIILAIIATVCFLGLLSKGNIVYETIKTLLNALGYLIIPVITISIIYIIIHFIYKYW